ncbi:TetR family transcriptional regulator, partial [Micromonospora aurantiaca]|nr:TetR family transcriptional regulator [Micromonospora aurantiaca]
RITAIVDELFLPLLTHYRKDQAPHGDAAAY